MWWICQWEWCCHINLQCKLCLYWWVSHWSKNYRISNHCSSHGSILSIQNLFKYDQWNIALLWYFILGLRFGRWRWRGEKIYVSLDDMDPIGGTILYQDIIRNYLSILDNSNIELIIFQINIVFFDPFWSGDANIVIGTLVIWSYGYCPVPILFYFLILSIGDGNDTIIVWGKYAILLFLYLHNRHRHQVWSLQVFGV